MPEDNTLGQPIGALVQRPYPCPLPAQVTLSGRHCRLAPLEVARDCHALYAAIGTQGEAALWTYLPDGPFADMAAFQAWFERCARSTDPLFYAILDAHSGAVQGMASYLRIEPRQGSIEVGYICYAPALQRTVAATEAMYLMMQYAFGLGYRRYEWKCNALNRPSRAAAQRLGFSYEGVFRQHMIVKGRNRDTAWYSLLDREWPRVQSAVSQWLDPSNFDESGRQRSTLTALTQPLLHARDPELRDIR